VHGVQIGTWKAPGGSEGLVWNPEAAGPYAAERMQYVTCLAATSRPGAHFPSVGAATSPVGPASLLLAACAPSANIQLYEVRQQCTMSVYLGNIVEHGAGKHACGGVAELFKRI
jgi:hypothetical protein